METSADTFSTANNPCKLLIFNQDSNLGRMLKENLEHDNYESNICHNIDQAYKLCRITDYTACIIDLQTTNNDGFKLAIGLKTLNSEISIIFIGKYSTKEEIVEAYHSGADDFVRKPFSLDELKARLYAILRRTQDLKVKKIRYYKFGQFLFDTQKQILSIGKKQTKLTTKEFEMLLFFCQNANRLIDRNHILKIIWKNDSYFNARSMDVYITKIRRLLADDPTISIVNIHGKGYKLITQPEG
ncbi:response regulator transcription factor [Parabacteroides bouchesdurhonensis]|uniref:response regulator transcription factor n=1 Tax=Parabacteroides bouchesdurhonensis TaxID=1936995 RepID=UPI000C8289A9|nr:response regulator transcription factor [Parabacteroides bouchesdurhonensis]